MNYLRIIASLLFISACATSTMNIQVPDAANSTNRITFFIPHEIWKGWVCMSSCKNILKFVNKYLHALASTPNKTELIKESLSITLPELCRTLLECVEQNKLTEAFFALQKAQQLGVKTPSSITNFDIPLWYYAQSSEMVAVLDNFGPRPNPSTKVFDTQFKIVQAARSGDTNTLQAEMNNFLSFGNQNDDNKQKLIALLTLVAHHACQANQIDCFTLLLPHVNKDDLLMAAVEVGNVACLTLLLKEHANPNYPGGDNTTPLSLAAREGKLVAVQLLLEHKADQMIANKDGFRPLNYALVHNHTSIAKLLISHLPDTQESKDYVNAAYLLNACIEGDVPAITTALESCHSINPLAFPHQPTLLHYAAEYGYLPVVELLIKHGFSVNEADSRGRTPLFLAASQGHLTTVQALHKAGANIHIQTKYGMSLCASAVLNNHLPILQYLAAHGADLKEISPEGETLLHHAADTKNSGPLTKYLLEQGLSFNQIHTFQHENLVEKSTPLHRACSNGHLSAVRELVAAGANMEQEVGDRGTPIGCACIRGISKIVRFFIEEYVKRNKLPNQALFNDLTLSAVHFGHIKVVELLLDAGARVNNELIELAHEEEHSEIEQLLRQVQEERRGISW